MTTNSSRGRAAPGRRKPPKADDAQPHVAVAPGLLDSEHTVIHEADDTDADYEGRCRLLAAALDFARKG